MGKFEIEITTQATRDLKNTLKLEIYQQSKK
jgi:hypothetical protein